MPMELWPQFWMDVSALQNTYTPINCLLNVSIALGFILAFVAAASHSWVVGGMALSLFCGALVVSSYYQSIDTFLDDMNHMIETKHNRCYFKHRGWTVRCHCEFALGHRGVQKKAWVLHLVPLANLEELRASRGTLITDQSNTTLPGSAPSREVL